MFEIIKSVINNKSYKLEDILYKINKMYVESYITETQKTELDNLARQNAIAENSYASVEVRMQDVYSRITNLEARLDKLEGKEQEEPTETVEEYPEYIQPTGAHDSYKIGDKVTYNGKKYICKMDNCVWSPEAYPQGWELVEEIPEEFFEELPDELEDNTKENTESEG